MSVPRVTTARLILRGIDRRDVAPYAVMMADPAVTRYLGDGQPLGPVDAWRQLALLVGHWTLRGFGLWAVEERATGAFVGRIGCFEPEGWPGFEVGYVIARPFWGQGYATEGAGAALRYARDVLGRDRIISLVRAGNVASIRVAERLGAVWEAEVEFHGSATQVYAYPRRPGEHPAHSGMDVRS